VQKFFVKERGELLFSFFKNQMNARISILKIRGDIANLLRGYSSYPKAIANIPNIAKPRRLQIWEKKIASFEKKINQKNREISQLRKKRDEYIREKVLPELKLTKRIARAALRTQPAIFGEYFGK